MVPRDTFGIDLIPASLKQRVVCAYSAAGGNAAVNPVHRVPVQVTGEGAQLHMIELYENSSNVPGDAPSQSQHAQNGMSVDTSRKEFTALHSQIFAVQHQIANVMNEIVRLRTDTQRINQRMLSVLHRIALQPVARTVRASDGHHIEEVAAPGSTVHQPHASLSKRPRDLFELWREFEFGLNGEKPAKEFTRSERGANKFAYSRRKVFWDAVAYLVRAGFTSDTAIDKIYAAYGRERPVTAILVELREDKKRGGHPSLRI
ncbi:hypothetical protein DVH05_002723 [Phytophthora capsici]|nr:hypothetical protein DVH05_002721 [Phytophthora capsici]KAG1689231.1 hypothetical protein DVH05_002723 [Phytophthora capsici]